MIEQLHKIGFMSSARRGIDLTVAGDEPSHIHIHIARPSRLLRRDNPVPSVEPTADEARDIEPACPRVTAQAA